MGLLPHSSKTAFIHLFSLHFVQNEIDHLEVPEWKKYFQNLHEEYLQKVKALLSNVIIFYSLLLKNEWQISYIAIKNQLYSGTSEHVTKCFCHAIRNCFYYRNNVNLFLKNNNEQQTSSIWKNDYVYENCSL